ncbi:N-acetyltransferase YodP [Thermincola ferriacetica]|uniref:N-acetyltransferase YodP n=1 Tax=Thermincola ferriacetica TaxID=281456 RepID=A0A0L6W5N8_9FIRM|nr:putative beta-lysine N-acetyltransferase [Thermincola ferriacetica]KNZ70840.1 N-acetyltransferase YodP [Thermincola ferriacetica]
MMMQYKFTGHKDCWEAVTPTTGLNINFDKFNRRLIVKDQGTGTTAQVIDYIEKIARKTAWMNKIIVFCREFRWKEFVSAGYMVEGFMNYYYKGRPAVLVSKFLDPERFLSKDFLQEDGVLEKIFGKSVSLSGRGLPAGFQIRAASPRAAYELAEFFQKVFDLYPTPIKDPNYLKYCMNNNYVFHVILHKNQIVSAASAEMDLDNKAAEITDCATLDNYRGQGLMFQLVQALEKDMENRPITTVFSLARAKSAGINSVFHKSGYKYRGRLVNNCRICTGFEDMNIWEKHLIK